MPFVDERISDEDSALVRWEQYEEYCHSWSVNPTHWTIDRERDVFIWLMRTATPGWPNQIFGLSWKGNARLRVEVIEELDCSCESPERLCDVHVKIMKVKVPDSLGAELESIKSVLKEAFDVYVRRQDEGKTRKVSFSVL